MKRWVAVDIGGANLKAADGHGRCASRPFPLWREPTNLTAELQTLLSASPPFDSLAVTMTGELADCFADKSTGVRFIAEATAAAVGDRALWFYRTDGRLVSLAETSADPLPAAASNWHVLARFAGRFAPRAGAVLVDIGSTTCDIIPLQDGVPRAVGHTDTTRLVAGELLYSGVERTPCCAVARQIPYRGRSCPLAAELFATMRDVYLLLDHLPEDAADSNTADGKPATKFWAARRLARLLCADESEWDLRDAQAIAEHLAAEQVQQLAAAIRQVTQASAAAVTTVIISGHGDFLALPALRQAEVAGERFSLNGRLGPEISRCAPAHALAVLAGETLA